ncbi:hypothetical protein [Helicobacter sp. 23-1045]
MSVKERVKFSLDLTKSFLFALLTALFGIIAFVVINIETITKFQLVISIIGAVIIAIMFVFAMRYLVKKLNELERL